MGRNSKTYLSEIKKVMEVDPPLCDRDHFILIKLQETTFLNTTLPPINNRHDKVNIQEILNYFQDPNLLSLKMYLQNAVP